MLGARFCFSSSSPRLICTFLPGSLSIYCILASSNQTSFLYLIITKCRLLRHQHWWRILAKGVRKSFFRGIHSRKPSCLVTLLTVVRPISKSLRLSVISSKNAWEFFSTALSTSCKIWGVIFDGLPDLSPSWTWPCARYLLTTLRTVEGATPRPRATCS